MSTVDVHPSVLRLGDVLRTAASGPKARKMRTALSAVGIAIGIAAMVGVLGLSDSSRSDLLSKIDALGTNLLTVSAGSGFGAGDAKLPEGAQGKVVRLASVEQTAAMYTVSAKVRRNEFVPEGQTNALSVKGADPSLLSTLRGTMREGRFLDDSSTAYPQAVVGAVAADRLGISSLNETSFVQIGNQKVEVIGILNTFMLAADLDRTVLIGHKAAVDYFDGPDEASTIYVRSVPAQLDGTRKVLPNTINPKNPEEVTISRPSDVLSAQAAAKSAFTQLFLGLGGVALLVGGVGIANVMVIAVIERRGEIGLRRALGATTSHIRRQFVTESILLSGLGGLAGVLLGVAVTFGYAKSQHWRVIIPPYAAVGGFFAAIAIGVIAGLYPAMRAARLSPTEALRSQ
jgi:putative ABC transport system permease protein